MSEPTRRKRVKRQHLIPQFYLRRFAVDGKVWVVDFHSDQPPYRNSVINTLCIRDFYTVETHSAKEDDSVEKLLSHSESEVQPVLDHLLKDMILPNGDARKKLDVFLALLFLRGPHFRQLQLELYESMVKTESMVHFSDEAVFDKVWEDFKTEQGDVKMTKEQARKILDESTIEGHLSRQSYVMSFLRAWPTMLAIFRGMALTESSISKATN